MGAVWMRFRAELRSRLLAMLSLALIVGVMGGVVIAAAAGARRTESAYPRFAQAQRALDLVVNPYGKDRRLAFPEVERLPQVEQFSRVTPFGGSVRNAEGRKLTFPDVFPVVSPDGRFGTTLNALKILSGRAADPTRPDEAVASFTVADRLDLQPGDRVELGFFGNGQFGQPLPPDRRPEPISLTVVGVGAAPGEFAPLAGGYLAGFHLTPALYREHRELFNPADMAIALRLRRGGSRHPGPQGRAECAAPTPARRVRPAVRPGPPDPGGPARHAGPGGPPLRNDPRPARSGRCPGLRDQPGPPVVDPRLSGWNWDALVGTDIDEQAPEATAEAARRKLEAALSGDPRVQAYSMGTLPYLSVGGADLRLTVPFFFDLPRIDQHTVVDLGRVGDVPLVLAGILALMAAATLAHTLVTSVRRRGRDLAILKALVIGVPLGIVVRAVGMDRARRPPGGGPGVRGPGHRRAPGHPRRHRRGEPGGRVAGPPGRPDPSRPDPPERVMGGVMMRLGSELRAKARSPVG